MLVTFSAHAQPPVEELVEAACAVRVGDPDTAADHLRSVPADSAGVHAILTARVQLQRGQAEAARVALTESIDPSLIEPAGLLRMRVALAQKDAPRVEALAQDLLELPNAAPTTIAEARLRMAQVQLKDPRSRPQAVATLRALADDVSVPSVRPVALGLLTKVEDEQRWAWRRLLIEHGETIEGRQAQSSLDPEIMPLTQRLTRARNLFTQRAYDLADVTYRSVAAGRASPAVRQEAALKRATLRLRLFEEYDEAKYQLRKAERGPNIKMRAEATFRLGVLYGRLGEYRKAIDAMQRSLRTRRRGRYSENAAYQIGRLNHESGRYRQAIPHLKRFLRRKLQDRGKYQWFLGWSYYRAGQHRKARKEFAKLADSTNTLVGAKALYWIARSYLAQNRPQQAKKSLYTLAARAPLSYYGLLGSALAAEHFGTSLLPERLTTASLPLPTDLTPFIEELGNHTLGEALRRIDLLTAAGYPRLARRLVNNALVNSAKKRLSPASFRALNAALDDRLERWGRRWRRTADQRIPWRENAYDVDQDQLITAYPPAYARLARAAGRPHGVSPYWLLSHMLQESRFTERARSHAGALGPMQVLPRTGRRIAKRLGFPSGDFLGAQLYEPGVALRHAAWYLDALRTEFGGNMLLAIAAYNGGPRRITDHLSRHPNLPFDVLIEEIGAHESRNYARKVADHVIRFASIWADSTERDALLQSLLPVMKLSKPRGETRF